MTPNPPAGQSFSMQQLSEIAQQYEPTAPFNLKEFCNIAQKARSMPYCCQEIVTKLAMISASPNIYQDFINEHGLDIMKAIQPLISFTRERQPLLRPASPYNEKFYEFFVNVVSWTTPFGDKRNKIVHYLLVQGLLLTAKESVRRITLQQPADGLQKQILERKIVAYERWSACCTIS